MHRVLNVKHRIVRRIDVGRAPLATFDSFDLGDEDEKSPQRKKNSSSTCVIKKDNNSDQITTALCDVASSKPGIIGGNTSKKALSQAGGEGGKEEKAVHPLTEGEDHNENHDNGAAREDKISPPLPSSPIAEKLPDNKEIKSLEDNEEKQFPKSPKKEQRAAAVDSAKATSSTPSGLSRQGTIGRVSIPIKKQSSISSSSSSEACNDSHFTFTTSRPSIAHLDSADGSNDLPDSPAGKSKFSNLVPENIDPKQILSPSKRKAYEKRLERLKVTTSPIARPRSNAPINVVTLDEYANLSSPESSPVTHSILQDKLKITLPSDEFAKGSKFSASRRKSEDTCFEFSEEILFRCTKSALVVDEDGHLPISPRRVLIPPTITPTNSPKLSSSPKIGTAEPTVTPKAQTAPKLIYMKEDADPTHRFFGLTFDQSENDNWADFTDSAINVEKADSESSEKETLDSTFPPCHKKESSDSLDFSEESSIAVTDKFDYSTDESKQKTTSERITADVFQDNLKDLRDEGYTTEDTSYFLSLTSSLGEYKSLGLSPEHSLCQTGFPEQISDCEDVNKISVSLEAHSSDAATAFKNLDDFETVSTAGGADTRSDVLIDLPSCTLEHENISSVLEAPKNELSCVSNEACVALDDDPFNLLGGVSAPIRDDSNIMLPAPFCPSVNINNKDAVQEDNIISSNSLNPFLQYIPPDSILLDTSSAVDTLDSNAHIHSHNKQQANVQASSNGHQLLATNTNLDATKSLSASDLIDFSSSLELELPPTE